ncbi:hypothetical protein [Aquabacterium sp. OR-4]|uniref:hypothetical protein n=1 Tax=Aquabacterium sp. OR-4 TaxID=2978127 RepID=UPI0021B338FB|nr:hypothetical protein [Aquabacterium sp. OR-4]MDT7837228.1 hypothetical protein [Aquabacterium sp. OR-4]
MRRQDIQLLAQARQGDVRARCELGRRYLLGVEGFTRHVAAGIDHLRQAAAVDAVAAARVLAECLPLHELLAQGQEAALQPAAAAGSVPAQLRLAAWLLVRRNGQAEARRWLGRAAGAPHAAAAAGAAALAALDAAAPGLALRDVLRALDAAAEVDGRAVATQAIAQARAQADLPALADALQAALGFPAGSQADLAPDLAAAVQLAESQGQVLHGVDGQALREALEICASQGDRDAAHTLGRGLSGLATPGVASEVFEGHQNMRKGAAFLLRAADAGCDAAWLLLYRLHADHSLSVANPQMARFFLEKAAARGLAEAQRKLGALMLRESSGLASSEQAIAWLHAAAAQHDAHAHTLLQSLVLPVQGSDAEAAWGIAQVQQSDPWLAARLQLARSFGLTKLEGLCVDVVDGHRPWGLVVGRNPFIQQVRLAAPRAIPATGGAAQQALQQAVLLYGQARGAAGEGDLRTRSLRQRRLFERLGLDEALYFADASATTLEALRLGSKWAWRARQPLSDALAA